jgi:hypothetical protein
MDDALYLAEATVEILPWWCLCSMLSGFSGAGMGYWLFWWARR